MPTFEAVNPYVFTIDGVRYYHAGDTDPIPEMESISCDVAFIPIGGYYTMDANEAPEAVKLIDPQLVVPMHFGFYVGLPSDGVPYPLFCYAALLPWLFFAECLGRSSQSVVGGGALLTKAYFPRLLLPLSSVVLALADLAVQLVLLLGLMAWYRVVPTAGLLLAPAFLLLGMAAAWPSACG